MCTCGYCRSSSPPASTASYFYQRQSSSCLSSSPCTYECVVYSVYVSVRGVQRVRMSVWCTACTYECVVYSVVCIPPQRPPQSPPPSTPTHPTPTYSRYKCIYHHNDHHNHPSSPHPPRTPDTSVYHHNDRHNHHFLPPTHTPYCRYKLDADALGIVLERADEMTVHPWPVYSVSTVLPLLMYPPFSCSSTSCRPRF
jgi:hypothetical protein